MTGPESANTRIISPLRKGPVAAWIVGFAALAIYTLYHDLSGTGLIQSQAYLALGYAIYPLFYGSMAYLIYHWLAMTVHARDYISEAGGTLRVGRRRIRIEDLASIEGRKNGLGLREIAFKQTDGSEFAIRAYILSRPYDQTLAALQLLARPKN